MTSPSHDKGGENHEENNSSKGLHSGCLVCRKNFNLLAYRKLDCMTKRLKELLFNSLFSLWNNAVVKFLTFRDEPIRTEIEFDSFISTVIFCLFMLSIWIVVFQIALFCARNLGILWMPASAGISLYIYVQIIRLFYGDR